jgi:hypothetical protein
MTTRLRTMPPVRRELLKQLIQELALEAAMWVK